MRQELPWHFVCHHVMAVQVLQPAIELAEDGFPLSPVTAHYWGLGLIQIQRQGGPGVKSFCTKDGKAPKAGQLHRNADLAATFRSVAENGALEGGSSTQRHQCDNAWQGQVLLRAKLAGAACLARCMSGHVGY